MRLRYRSMLLCASICLAAAALSCDREGSPAAQAGANAAPPAARVGPAVTDEQVHAELHKTLATLEKRRGELRAIDRNIRWLEGRIANVQYVVQEKTKILSAGKKRLGELSASFHPG